MKRIAIVKDMEIDALAELTKAINRFRYAIEALANSETPAAFQYETNKLLTMYEEAIQIRTAWETIE